MNEILHIVCPECGAKNRVDSLCAEKKRVNCGHCKHELLAPELAVLTDANFGAYVAGTKLPIVVDFWAPWCAPCRMMAPQFEASAKALPQVRHVKLDTEANPRTAMQFGIRSIPTLLLFKNGEEIARTSGAMSAQALQQWITKNIA